MTEKEKLDAFLAANKAEIENAKKLLDNEKNLRLAAYFEYEKSKEGRFFHGYTKGEYCLILSSKGSKFSFLEISKDGVYLSERDYFALDLDDNNEVELKEILPLLDKVIGRLEMIRILDLEGLRNEFNV